jgi:hypothetical protein
LAHLLIGGNAKACRTLCAASIALVVVLEKRPVSGQSVLLFAIITLWRWWFETLPG